MRLLFEHLAGKCFPSEERIEKFEKWIEDANYARKIPSQKGTVSDKKANQYYKAEELITFYTFAPLCLREDQPELVQEILKLANIKTEAEKITSLGFESQIRPPEGYLKWLANYVNEHPVKYVRKEAEDHVKHRKTLETNTHVDVTIESENLLLLIEMKFTSDISTQTTFNPNRNQLARLIDVGIEVAKKDNKKLVVLVCSPEEFFDRKSRLFYYKIRDYSDYREVKKDIEWRPQEEIEKYLLKVAWVPLEEVIRILYTGFSHSDKAEALAFFEERKLSKPDILF
jgi:hypothetical protein